MDGQEPYLHEGLYGCGALWRPPDPRAYDMRRLRTVRAMLLTGFPDNDEHLKEHIAYTYNQGASPSCCSHMAAAMSTTNEHIERKGELLVFNAMQLHNETGPPNTGRYPGDILKVAQDRGVPLAGSSKRYRIGSYAFAPTTTPEEWTAVMKAAIAAGHVCGLALRLPSQFGWESGGTVLGPETYHEILAVGYRATPAPLGSFLIKNSWGAGWGQNGFGWVPVHLLTDANFQQGYTIGNTVIDALDDDLTPNPPPPPPPPPNDFAAQVFTLTNQARQQAGLKPLQPHPALQKSAQSFAQWMGDHNAYGHEADGKTPIQRMTEAGLPAGWSNWGENIAAGQTDPSQPSVPIVVAADFLEDAIAGRITGDAASPAGAFTAWMGSPEHRANILFPGHTHLGCGYAHHPGSQYGDYWVQDFAALPEGTPPPPPPPPVTGRTLTGKVTGSGLASLAVGQTLIVTSRTFGGQLVVTQISEDGDVTPPPPPPPPPPPGGLSIPTPYTHRARGRLIIAAELQGADGKVTTGTVKGTIGGVTLAELPTNPNRGATWSVNGVPAGAAGTLTGAAGNATAAVEFVAP